MSSFLFLLPEERWAPNLRTLPVLPDVFSEKYERKFANAVKMNEQSFHRQRKVSLTCLDEADALLDENGARLACVEFGTESDSFGPQSKAPPKQATSAPDEFPIAVCSAYSPKTSIWW
ncbi:hypothetical protein CNYM01_12959 [Colletotrichum nymphaeae SA-01]|uniref:Uncharacterized protein n=1 Tax=Colletotrichum nymphaeae SA-01 TaxID=1460502 RepID=A0A135UU29_9PEZI|nr:hypothetical protein CNYM01_12959 [Colletotrichum nymphaeae SA-01]